MEFAQSPDLLSIFIGGNFQAEAEVIICLAFSSKYKGTNNQRLFYSFLVGFRSEFHDFIVIVTTEVTITPPIKHASRGHALPTDGLQHSRGLLLIQHFSPKP